MKSSSHKNLQEAIKNYHREKGHIAIIEHYIMGKKIDVLVQDIKTKHTIAYEIQLTYKHFRENILLDFKTGCDEVRIICIDNTTLEQIKRRASSVIDKTLLDKTKFQHIGDFFPHLNNRNNTKFWK